jgi:hypothetical protein
MRSSALRPRAGSSSRVVADSVIADIRRMPVHQTTTGPLADVLQGGLAGGGPFALFDEGRRCRRAPAGCVLR